MLLYEEIRLHKSIKLGPKGEITQSFLSNHGKEMPKEAYEQESRNLINNDRFDHERYNQTKGALLKSIKAPIIKISRSQREN